MNSTEGTEGAMIFEDLYVDIICASSPPPLLSFAVLGMDLRTAGTWALLSWMGRGHISHPAAMYTPSC